MLAFMVLFIVEIDNHPVSGALQLMGTRRVGIERREMPAPFCDMQETLWVANYYSCGNGRANRPVIL